MDFVTYKNQLEACRRTGGLGVPHPAFQPLKSKTGMPLTSPWQVIALGQRVKTTQPASRPRPLVATPPTNIPSVSQSLWTAAQSEPYSAHVEEEYDEGLLQRVATWVARAVYVTVLAGGIGVIVYVGFAIFGSR